MDLADHLLVPLIPGEGAGGEGRRLSKRVYTDQRMVRSLALGL